MSIFVFITFFFTSIHAQSVLFPHGYFDTNKLSAFDAFYLHMLAVSTLEQGGVSIDQLDQLWKNRVKVARPAPKSESGIQQETLATTTTMETASKLSKGNKERPPKEPFRRSRATDENDDIDESSVDENPFDSIATRPPRTPRPIVGPRQFLTWDKILGNLGRPTQRPRHFEQRVGITKRGPGIGQNDQVDEDGGFATEATVRKRKLYAKIDWTRPHIIELPVPIELE